MEIKEIITASADYRRPGTFVPGLFVCQNGPGGRR